MALEIGEICRDISAGDPPGSLTAYLLDHQTLAVGDPESPDEDPIFVLPDLHLLSGDLSYHDSFHLNDRLKARLLALLRRLRALRANAAYGCMRVVQIGDFHDLWRESRHWWGESLGAMLGRQIEAHADLFELLAELGCHRVVGNHDERLGHQGVLDSLRDHPISAYFPPGSVHPSPISLCRGSFGRVDLLHGHEVDPGEQVWWRRWLNPIGCRFAGLGFVSTDEWQHEVLPEGTPDTLLEQPPVVYLPGDVDAPRADNQRYYRELADHPTCADDAPDELRERHRSAVVIGHTHHPRIVSGAHGSDYVLVDCGSWVNRSSAVDHPHDRKLVFWNGQLGILSGPWAAVVQIGLS
jgi:UDP-2,3-diacylglucosamine pyrophosphatase LpxH